MMAENSLRLLVADSSPLFGQAVQLVLRREQGFDVSAAQDGESAVRAALRTRPNVLLYDPELDSSGTTGLVARVKAALPTCKIIALVAIEDDQTLLRAVESGANAYLAKKHSLSELVDTVCAVHRGETLIPSRMLGNLLVTLLRNNQERDQALERIGRLTPREKEVLALLAEGATGEGIAESLVISTQTARTHIQNLLQKLGVHSRLEAATFAMQARVREVLSEQILQQATRWDKKRSGGPGESSRHRSTLQGGR